MRKVTNFQNFFRKLKNPPGGGRFGRKKVRSARGYYGLCGTFVPAGTGGAQKFFASHFGGYASGAKHPCSLRREGDMQAVRSTLAGFAEKGVVAQLAVTGVGYANASAFAGFAEKRKPAFSRENNGRSLQSKPSRYHQYENFLQTPLLYVLSFLKRKYERKQFEGHIPSKTPLKVQGGTFPTRQLYQSKGGSAVRILKAFNCAELLYLR